MKIDRLIIALIIILMSSVGIAENFTNKTIYRAGIDHRGFYRVFNATSSGLVPYKNYTLDINVGDTLLWENDEVPDTKYTIVSEQKLWDSHKGELKWAYKQFTYTFNQSGIYSVFLKEHPKQKQKIIVGSIPIIVPTPKHTPKTPNFNPKPSTPKSKLTNMSSVKLKSKLKSKLTNMSGVKLKSNIETIKKNPTSIYGIFRNMTIEDILKFILEPYSK